MRAGVSDGSSDYTQRQTWVLKGPGGKARAGVSREGERQAEESRCGVNPGQADPERSILHFSMANALSSLFQ